MKINAQEILLVNKTRKLGETTPETTGDKTIDAPVSNPESTLKALELQGKNNLAFQGVNQSLLQKARQLPKAAVMAMAILAGSSSMTSCMEQYQYHEDHSAELITLLKDHLDKNHEETNALLLRIISLLEQNIQISKDQQGLLIKILNQLQVLDENDKEGRAILNAILAKIEQAVADGKEIDAKTIALLETIASNQDKYGKETKELLLIVIQKIDNLDNTVKTELTNVLGKMDELGNEQKDLLVQVLKAINMNNTLSATNNNMLSLVLRQLADLNKNDKESIALLNKIWTAIEKSIKENKEMDKKTQKATMSPRMKKAFTIFSVLVLVFSFSTVAFATNDPLEVINNLSEFIFGLIRAIGIILLAFGIVQVGLALKSHDPSQRANGFLTLAGGIIITFAREILTLITG